MEQTCHTDTGKDVNRAGRAIGCRLAIVLARTGEFVSDKCTAGSDRFSEAVSSVILAAR